MNTLISNVISILIVDDNLQNLQVLGKFLRAEKYEIEFAISGETTFEWLKNKKFDLILLDINMPGMNGFDVCKIIRANGIYNNLPVIFLSAESERESILKGFDVGAQDYVTKPFDKRELLARVKTHLELKHARDQQNQLNQWLEDKVQERTEELQEANSKLEVANLELETLDKAKSDFLRIITHEINTPLSGIIGFIDILKGELINSEFYEMFQYLEVSAKRLEHFSMVSLRITELRTNNQTVKKEESSLHLMIETVKQNMAEQIEAKGINFFIEGEVKDPIIYGETELIKFCFESILKNAINYSEKKGTITMLINSVDNQTTCSFIDQGSGFSSIALKNLYQLFAPGEKHVDENKGLDLALVKLIMDAHKGEIKVFNNEGHGATVTLTFPGYHKYN
jgi:two-component system, sensor histidine kinase and response regulator